MTGFFKLSGSGNDFIAVADPAGTAVAPPAERIRAWCRRGISLGADGFFLLRRQTGGAKMEYWNADGEPADLCLNGTRCAAQLAFHLGWAKGEALITTGAGVVAAQRLDTTRVSVRLPAPAEAPREMTLEAAGGTWTGWTVHTGVPHLVLLWQESLAQAPVHELGRALRYHPSFAPVGRNVNFVRFPRPDCMEIRTYERGVEGETLACGTGMLAGTAVGLHLGSTLPLSILTQGGCELTVASLEGGAWSLAGDARLVAQGDLLAGADLAPVSPSWS
ncbi:MAG TPA: diaminopimelate epimerase [Thermoanaerobaculia bacterium]|nr:diaminopimelate epimerase [Thermoanaerobaculia bacterium]